MPEWPEMETYRNLLAERLVGSLITGTEVTRDKSINVTPDLFEKELTGRTVWFLEHRGKFLIFHLDNGKRLLLHLMLGGSLYFGSDEDMPKRTAQVTLRFPQGNLYFIGLRLGYLHLMTVKEITERLNGIGPEPFDKRLDAEQFRKRFAGKRGRLKTALVDQGTIAGIGNCYADEIAFEAGVRPTVAISAIKPETWDKLYAALHSVLKRAVSYGGYMEQPLYAGETLLGGYNDNCLVYDRGGEACGRCGTPIVQGELSSRKVFYCPSCQKEE
jgi:formamidopyrimidine-DNA glycosylase